jgi:hypothetical protein
MDVSHQHQVLPHHLQQLSHHAHELAHVDGMQPPLPVGKAPRSLSLSLSLS